MQETLKKHQFALICLALAAATIGVYWQVVNFKFISFDDDWYIYKNSFIKEGLTKGSIAWAFSFVDKAIEQLEKLLQKAPDLANVHRDMAYCLIQKGRYDEAIMQIREYIRLQPDSVADYRAIGNIYLQPNAIEALNKAIGLAKSGGEDKLVRQIQAQLKALESQ
jgi:tetratricopeptide (TPR) repeat protein